MKMFDYINNGTDYYVYILTDLTTVANYKQLFKYRMVILNGYSNRY